MLKELRHRLFEEFLKKLLRKFRRISKKTVRYAEEISLETARGNHEKVSLVFFNEFSGNRAAGNIF